ncbi:hypothetical protein FQN54_003353 [Arachnomyces sp. PD_36]|nr:hypothetical protein FQN54_003353 [Arachnomyces sp. PD_36]
MFNPPSPVLASKRFLPILLLTTFIVFLFLLHSVSSGGAVYGIPQAVGFGESVRNGAGGGKSQSAQKQNPFPQGQLKNQGSEFEPRPLYKPGVTKPPGSNYTRTLVIPKMKHEDDSWIATELPDVEAAVYVVNDPDAPLHPPRNKGHEVMVYLSFIIDNYEDLPDVMIFMHAHQHSWHNEEVFDFDAAEMIRRLSSERITREGYMNMRCGWGPGCPDWMHPGNVEQDVNKQEETMIAKSWSEIFPLDPIPQVLAQPCCAQFAISRDRALANPKSRYVYYRDWLLRTELTDYISGRIWEYLWHVIFTGEPVFCPNQACCYCDAYGLCFGGDEQLENFFGMRNEINDRNDELNAWRDKAAAIERAQRKGRFDEAARLEIPEPGRDQVLMAEVEEKQELLGTLRAEALKRGENPRNRALECGRPWKQGDGF